MNFTGDIEIFLKCLGEIIDSPIILDAFVILACPFYIEEYEIENVKREAWRFYSRGSEFSFENNIAKAFFFHVKKNHSYEYYPFLDTLINGVTYDSTKLQLINIFGTPEKTSFTSIGSYIRYKMHNKYLHFQFNKDEELDMITLFIDKEQS